MFKRSFRSLMVLLFASILVLSACSGGSQSGSSDKGEKELLIAIVSMVKFKGKAIFMQCLRMLDHLL